jgi:pyruvate,orthophosphate dikinase
LSKHAEQVWSILPGRSAEQDPGPEIIGSKAHGLARLARLGIPVPPAFVLGTGFCRAYHAAGGKLPGKLRELLAQGLARLEEATDKSFGRQRRPLLVSVRSGAPVSMPGMMDTVLNIGLTEQSLGGLLRATGNPRLVHDCRRRLIRDFAKVVHGTDGGGFERLAERASTGERVESARELGSAALQTVARESLELYLALTGHPFPDDPMEQLLAAVEAVFRSWNSPRALAYRKLNRIDEDLGTAVTVQAMVYGNAGSLSGAGVGFTRDPATGERGLYLDFLFDAQGEDVVSGRQAVARSDNLARRLPALAAELARNAEALEAEFQEVQDFEFTVEEGQLYLLQTRGAKLAPWAALKIAVAMVREGLIKPAEALRRLDGIALDRLERLSFRDGAGEAPLAHAVPASSGAAIGAIAFDPERAAALAAAGKPAILVREDIATDDIAGIAAAEGILTARGGRTSHAAVVARQLGKVCLVGCSGLKIEADGRGCAIGATRFQEGDDLTLDGDGGRIYAGRLALTRERPEAELAEVTRWRAG